MALTALIAACVAMALAALGAGSIPISAAAAGAFGGGDADPASRYAAFSSFGAGLLVSTGVAVVVPEAFHALMALELAGNAAHAHEHDGHDHDHAHAHDHGGHVSHAVPDWAPGAALLAGVAVMQVLDFLTSGTAGGGGGCGSALAGGAGTAHASDGEGEVPAAAAPGGRAYAPPPDASLPQTGRSARSSAAAGSGGGLASLLPAPLAALFPPGDPAGSALLSMVVHAAADGIAVGAATLDQTAEVLVLVAMVAHKGPGALGLASLLVAARWPLDRARTGLALFAAASPLAAVVTYALLGSLGAAAGTAGGATAALALLFSGGTLLHAALGHVLPAASRASRQAGGRGLAMAAGAAVPLLLSAVAPHGH